MKNYHIRIENGHHVVHILSEKELELVESVRELFSDVYDHIKSLATTVVDFIDNNIDFEKLKELELEEEDIAEITDKTTQ